jgi:hypothetical protein
MTTEISAPAPSPKTMSSLELVEFINAERKSEGAKNAIRHDNFMKKVEAHPGIDSPKFLGEYRDSTGRTLKCYHLPKREAELMVMSESLVVQTRLYDKLQTLLDTPVYAAPTLTNPVMNMIMQQAIQYDKLEQQTKALAIGLQQNVQAVSDVAHRATVIEAKLNTEPDYFTIVGWCKLIKKQVLNKEASELGKAAKAATLAAGLSVKEVSSEAFGKVNIYPASILEAVVGPRL